MAVENVLDGIVDELNVEIPLFPDERKRKFRKYRELKKFIDREVEYWRPWRSSQVRYVFVAFQGIQSSLQQALETPEEKRAQKLVRNAFAEATRSHSPLPYSETATGKFLGDLQVRNSASALSAYNYLILGNIRESFKNKDSLDGLLLAFHFNNPNAFSDKIAATEHSFVQLAENHQAIKDGLEQNADKLMADIARRHETVSNNVNVWKTALEKEIQSWREGQQNAFDNRIQSNIQQFTTFCDENRNKLEKLERAYAEKLRLEGPAKYWDTFAENYEMRGREWRNWALGIAGVFFLFGFVFLHKSPSWFLSPEFTAASLRGTVLVALAVSILIYFIRLFVKLSTSAYHLSRDARERYQLTHVFLAMIKEGAIETKDHEIILQALFSRADTGLLKTDGGPTMPTGPIGNILRSIRGQH